MLIANLPQTHDFIEIQHFVNEKNSFLQTSSIFEKRMKNGHYSLIEHICQYQPSDFIDEEIKNGKRFIIVGDKKVLNNKTYYKILIEAKECIDIEPTLKTDLQNKAFQYIL